MSMVYCCYARVQEFASFPLLIPLLLSLLTSPHLPIFAIFITLMLSGPQDGQWWLARKGTKQGFIPSNYVAEYRQVSFEGQSKLYLIAGFFMFVDFSMAY